MQIPWLFPDFSQYSFFSLTFNKIPWLFPDFCQVWNFPDFSLTAGHPDIAIFMYITMLCHINLCYTVYISEKNGLLYFFPTLIWHVIVILICTPPPPKKKKKKKKNIYPTPVGLDHY